MKVQLAHILQSLYRTTELDDVPVHRLQETLREHPYFTAAQFLLIQKLRSQHSEQYDEQVEKAAIYFHDPLWMHWQLNHDEEAALKIESPSVTVQEHIETNGTVHARVERIAEAEEDQEIVEISNSLHTESYPVSGEAGFVEQHAEVEQDVHEEQQHVSFIENIDQFHSQERDMHSAIPGAHAEPDTHVAETDIHIGETDTPTAQSDIITAESDTQSFYSDSHPSERNTDVDESGRNEWSSVAESIHDNGVETIESQEQTIESSVDPAESTIEATAPTYESTEASGETIEATGPTFESTEPSTETIEPSSKIIRDDSEHRPIEETNPVIQMTDTATTSQAETSSAPKAEKEHIPFDPYYTIDYFASQGIKVPAEVEPTDKLGRQLKSFTEWLKTMKRLPHVPVEHQVEEPDEAAQQDIRRFADASLKDKEVVTETMAEVLIKQDRKEEAIGIYEKLSLLDPSKSAYFAAKIENLKVN
ncbi:MAG TPA: hypothetical protein VFZ47_07340 [Chitinophagaceae bacterium]